MKVISVHTGSSKTVSWQGREITTSIFKYPIETPVSVKSLGLETDTQSDLRVHGGKFKAVYAYPLEHYDFWTKKLPHFDFQWGTFGENLTVTGLFEEDVHLGDIMKIGNVLLKVTQPRFPCFKLGVRFDDQKMISEFLKSRRSGFYYEVLEEGMLKKGDDIRIIEKSKGISIKTWVDIYAGVQPDANIIRSVLDDANLIDDWRQYFEKKLTKVS